MVKVSIVGVRGEIAPSRKAISILYSLDIVIYYYLCVLCISLRVLVRRYLNTSLIDV